MFWDGSEHMTVAADFLIGKQAALMTPMKSLSTMTGLQGQAVGIGYTRTR
jgi:hypothetical protein